MPKCTMMRALVLELASEINASINCQCITYDALQDISCTNLKQLLKIPSNSKSSTSINGCNFHLPRI